MALTKVHRYWAKGSVPLRMKRRDWNIVCFGASDESIEDAAHNGRLRAEGVREAFLRGVPSRSYQYTDRPLREELKREIHQHGELAAAITRNNYGSLVLNTARVMFIDIDLVPDKVVASPPSILSWLFGKRPKEPRPGGDAYIQIDEFRKKADQHGIGLRLYRTPNGYRCLVTSRLFEPTSDEALGLLRAFGSDELYIKMCRVQDCFRARLTPKPWRIDAPVPPSRFPWVEQKRELVHRQWERDYEERIRGYSACTFVGHCGDETVLEDIAEIVKVHDSLACTGGALA